MSDLISRSGLYNKLVELEDMARKRVLDTTTNSPCYMRYVTQLTERTNFKYMVADAPTIEAVPIKHGKWKICLDEFDCEYIACSLCGSEFYDEDNYTFDTPYNFCPNCGAKMKGE